MTRSQVTIRPYEPEDALDLFRAARESLPDLGVWMPWAHPDYTLEESRAFIAGRPESEAMGTSYQFAIVEAGRYAGGCGLSDFRADDRMANLGYWVRRSARRHGVATAAVRLVADWAFANTTVNRIEIVVAVENSASQGVAERAGARREAVLAERLVLPDGPHDAVMFAILRSCWMRAAQ
jgi:RimJ/RimL family protein N-acetyltransferase